MPASLFFYDLETSGLNPRSARIMQFAGQRTDMDLRPVGEPINILIKLTPDVLPDADAVLVTGITPQATLSDGVTEAEFLKFFYQTIATPNTVFLGYNSIRFDDEFMRFLHYRNFYDAYQWHWCDGCSRWDVLDVVRLTRALRPEGIKWPFDSSGAPSNRLELLTSLNEVDHTNAHDALNDVNATIAVARLIKDRQPKMFDYLFGMRDKKKVTELTQSGQPFVYASGKYPSQFEKTAVVMSLIAHPKKRGMLVYDLRHDPSKFLSLSVEEIAERWRWVKEPTSPRLPVKVLQYNRCPAIAPLGVLDESTQKRLKMDLTTIQRHYNLIKAAVDWPDKLLGAIEILDRKQQTALLTHEQDVDGKLYDGFLDSHDNNLLSVVRAAQPGELSELREEFHDSRLKALLPLYKARNYPASLTTEERTEWENFCQQRLFEGQEQNRIARYFHRLQELASRTTNAQQMYLIEELRLYGGSIMPSEALA